MNKENNLTSQKQNAVNKEFICPLCKMNTPLIQAIYIDQKTQSPFVSLICKCNPKNERFDISLSKCINLKRGKQNCFKHENCEGKFYCKKCSLYMCETCYTYHSLFKNDHEKNIESVNEKKEESTNCDTVNTITHSNLRRFNVYEGGYNKLLCEYNDFISSEVKIIDDMIFNLNQLKKDIEIKKEIVLINSNQILDFIKALYTDLSNQSTTIGKTINIEKIVNIQKISPIDSIILKQDHEMISKICIQFNQIIQSLLKQQCQIVNRPIVSVDNKEEMSTNRQISTTVGMTELAQIEGDTPQDECMTYEIKKHINKNYIDITPTISPVFDEAEQIHLFSQNSSQLFNDSDNNNNLNESNNDITDNYNVQNVSNNKNEILTQEESLFALTEHSNAITCMIQLYNNRNDTINHQIVTASNETYIIFWNSSNYQAVNRMTSRKGNINIVKELADGSLALAYDNNIIKIYIIPEQICTSILIGHSNIITSMIEPAPSVLATSSRDATIKFWDLKQNSCSDSISEHTKGVNCLLYIKENTFASCSDDKRILIFDNKKIIFELVGHKGRIYNLCKITSTVMASCGEDSDVKLWDYTKGICIGSLIKHNAPINEIICISQDESNPLLLSISNDKSMIVWNMEKRSNIKKINNAHSQAITSVLLTDDGKILTGGIDGLIKIWI